ncbi:hypothetical protein [Paraburkholderia azotifigens]|uniref:hypothetical protein n=1 Tax=Paraburkholderia azotifigens TaxID=2057004 RepID=UPI001315629B|nr:hypothetical protein [Paraburkholderia azotifigens]
MTTKIMNGVLVACLPLCLVLSACGMGELPPIDLSKSDYLVRSIAVSEPKPSLSGFTFENSAPPPNDIERSAFKTEAIPIKAHTADTVASDLAAYVNNATTHSSHSDQRLIVRLVTADAYFLETVADRAPIVAIFALGGDRTYVMHVRVEFEVEKGGKVARTLTVDEKYTLADGKAGGTPQISASYERLIERYRAEFFRKLDSSLIARYLD